MSNGGTISSQHFIEQLKAKHPEWKQSDGTWPDDKVIYSMGRSQYSNLPVQDMPGSGYEKKVVDTSPYNFAEGYKKKTSESNFLDYLDWGIDEDSSMVMRLAYANSLQGLTDDYLRGEQRFTFERQPKIWEEAIGGALSFFMPMDFASLFVGGGIGKAASLAHTGSKMAARGWLKRASRTLARKTNNKISTELAENSISKLMQNEFAFVPFEAAKANLNAQVAHIRDPEGHPNPMTSEEIWSETWKGAVHGGVIAAAISLPQSFLATQHAKALRMAEASQMRKNLKHAGKKIFGKGDTKSFQNYAAYTGKLPQFASEYVGLNLADFTMQAALHGHVKSWEELGHDGLVNLGMLGSMKVGGIAFDATVGRMIRKSKEAYKVDFRNKKDELERNENVQKHMDDKSKSQKDSDVESSSTQKTKNSIKSYEEYLEYRKKYEESKDAKEIATLEAELKAYQKSRDAITDKSKWKEVQDTLYKLRTVVNRVIGNAEQAGYKGHMEDILKLETWIDQFDAQILQHISKGPQSKAIRLNTAINQLRANGIKQLKNRKGEDVKPEELTMQDLDVAESAVRDTKSNIDTKSIDLSSNEKKLVDTSKLNEKELDNISKTDKNPDMRDSAENIKKHQKEIHKDNQNIENDGELTGNQKKAARTNNEIIETYATDSALRAESKRGTRGAADKSYLIEKSTQNTYINEIRRFAQWLRAKKIPYKLTNVPKELIREYMAQIPSKDSTRRSAMSKFFQYLDGKGLMDKTTYGDTFIKSIFKMKFLGTKTKSKGLSASQVVDDGSIDVSLTMGKGERGKQITFSDSKSTKGYGGTLKEIFRRIKKQLVGNEALDTKDGNILDNLFTFRDTNGSVKVVSQNMFNKIAKVVFGSKITGKKFRKALSTYVYNKYGGDSREFAIVAKLGLGHKDPLSLSKQDAAYIAGIKKPMDALPEFQKLQNEFVQQIFNKLTPKDLQNINAKTLKSKYGMIKGQWGETDGITLYELKRGFRVLERLIETADKDGYVTLGKENIKIHKDTLRGMFRFMAETSARPQEAFMADKNATKFNIPIHRNLTETSKRMSDLLQKLNNEKSLLDLVDLEWLIPVEGGPAGQGAYKPNIKFKVNAPDSRLSLIQKVAATLKHQEVSIKNKTQKFQRRVLGNVRYEKMLKTLFDGLGFGDEVVAKGLKTGDGKYSLKNLGPSELVEILDVLNHKKRGPELLAKLSDNPLSAGIIKLKQIRDKFQIPMSESRKLLKALGVKDGDINNINRAETLKIVENYFKEFPKQKKPNSRTTSSEFVIMMAASGHHIPWIHKAVMPIYYLIRQSKAKGANRLADMFLEFDVVFTRDKAYADNIILQISSLLGSGANRIEFISKDMRTQKARILNNGKFSKGNRPLSKKDKAAIEAFDLKNPQTKKKWKSTDEGFDQLTDFQQKHILAREWHKQLTDFYWERTLQVAKMHLSPEKFAKYEKTLSKKYLENYMTRALNPEVIQAIARSGVQTHFIKEMVDVELRRVAREKATKRYKRGTDKWKEQYEKNLNSDSLYREIQNEVYDIITNSPHRIINKHFKERGLLLPEKVKIKTTWGNTKEVDAYSKDYNAIMDRYATVSSKYISTVRFFPEFTDIGGQYKIKGDAKSIFIEMQKHGDIGKYSATAFARVLGLNETITGHKFQGLHKFLTASSTLSAATGLSSPTSGIKNVLIGLPRTIGTFGYINTLRGIARLFGNYSEEMDAARKGGYATYYSKSLGLAEKKINAPILKEFSMDRVFKWNLMTQGEGWVRIVSNIAGNLSFEQSLDAYHGRINIMKMTSKKHIEKMWRDVFKLSQDEITMLKKKSTWKRMKKGETDPEMMALTDMIHAKVSHYSHVATQGGTSPQLLPMWMSQRWARPLTLFYRMAASNSHDMYLNHIKPISETGNFMPLLRTTSASMLSGAALWHMYEWAFDVENPTDHDNALEVALSYLWRAEYLQLFSDVINPYEFFWQSKDSAGKWRGFGDQMMWSQNNPILGAAVMKNVTSAVVNLYKWGPIVQAGKKVGIDMSSYLGNPHATGKQAMDDFLRETFVLYGQVRKKIAISPDVYKHDELYIGSKKFRTYANKFRQKYGYTKSTINMTSERTLYYRALKDAFYANDNDEFVKAYWKSYNFIFTELMKDQNARTKDGNIIRLNINQMHSKVVAQINQSLSSMSLSGISTSVDKSGNLVPDQLFRKYLGDDVGEYHRLSKVYGRRLREMRRVAIQKQNELRWSLIYNRRYQK